MKKCPKCGSRMYESEDHSTKYNKAYSCGNYECENILIVPQVRCCDCKNCDFVPGDSFPFHCDETNQCMKRIEYREECESFDPL